MDTRIRYFGGGWRSDWNSDFPLALVWPNFMQVAGNVIALPLFMEVLHSFEAIFLGIYMYTWDRFRNPYTHWSLTIPIVAGAGMSAILLRR